MTRGHIAYLPVEAGCKPAIVAVVETPPVTTPAVGW